MNSEIFLGGLIGCAVGDALGAPYEGLWSKDIPKGNKLLAKFANFDGYSYGQYTDDTQLTVATLESIVKHNEICPYLIAKSIFELWKTQAVIGPGGACTRSADVFFRTNNPDTCGAPKGNAGNGTAMRTAVLGLFFADCSENLPSIVADISKITHHDSRSIAGGIAIAKAGQLLATKKVINSKEICFEIADSIESYNVKFANLIRKLPEYILKNDKDILQKIAWSGMISPEFKDPIITPFVIPTVMASLWSFLRNKNSWEDAVSCAIQFGGDVDTLGAIVGALSGIHLGFSAIPSHLSNCVQRSKYLQDLARKCCAYVKYSKF